MTLPFCGTITLSDVWRDGLARTEDQLQVRSAVTSGLVQILDPGGPVAARRG
jgi:hypothetical protein